MVGLLAAKRAAAQSVRIAGPETTIFDWTTDRCSTDHIADLPARAFRDAAGQVHLPVSHFETRRLSGPTLDGETVYALNHVEYQGQSARPVTGIRGPSASCGASTTRCQAISSGGRTGGCS